LKTPWGVLIDAGMVLGLAVYLFGVIILMPLRGLRKLQESWSKELKYGVRITKSL
jgi:hypothetical protein